MSLMGKATMEGLEGVAREVLKPHFHDEPVTPKKVSCFVCPSCAKGRSRWKRDVCVLGEVDRVLLTDVSVLATAVCHQA